MHSRLFSLILGCSFAGLLVCSAFAGDPQLETAAALAPEAVTSAVRDTLNPQGFRIVADGKVIAEFWLRKQVPVNESTGNALGVSFGKLVPSTLIGVASFPEGWSDYKGKPVAAGLYTLRYGVQPADGNHMGVSLYRDFLLLIPAAADTDPNTSYSYNDLLALSKKASSTPHPSVLSLFPVAKEITSPQLVKNDLDQWMVEAKAGSIALGLVIVGKGEVEG